MSGIFAIISPIYIAILLGYGATRMGLFGKADTRVFGKFVINFALPALIFNAVSQRPIAEVLNASYMAAYLGGSLTMLVIGYFCARRLGKLDHTGSTFAAMGVSCSNSGYIGLPILLATMPAMASVALAMNVIIENVIVIPLLLMMAESGRQDSGPPLRVFLQTLVRVARMPLVMGLVAGLAVSLMGWSLPSPVARTVTLFAQASGALSLFVIGGTLVGLPLHGLEVHEPDMVGVKGYDAGILQALTRHDLWIVSKSSNANSITHWVAGSLKALRRVERDLARDWPNSEIAVRPVAMVSAIGSDLRGVGVVRRGLEALEDAGIEMLAVQQGLRRVEVQFIVPRDDRDAAVSALHARLIEAAAAPPLSPAMAAE